MMLIMFFPLQMIKVCQMHIQLQCKSILPGSSYIVEAKNYLKVYIYIPV